MRCPRPAPERRRNGGGRWWVTDGLDDHVGGAGTTADVHRSCLPHVQQPREPFTGGTLKLRWTIFLSVETHRSCGVRRSAARRSRYMCTVSNRLLRRWRRPIFTEVRPSVLDALRLRPALVVLKIAAGFVSLLENEIAATTEPSQIEFVRSMKRFRKRRPIKSLARA